jgi:hypothetical protein
MGWKFWQKKEIASGPSGGKIHRLGKPREIPHEVGRHLVVEQGLDPDYVWSLKCVRKLKEGSKSAFDIRIFRSETVAKRGVKVRDYTSLDNHADLIIFAGWYDKKTQSVHLDRQIKEAV